MIADKYFNDFEGTVDYLKQVPYDVTRRELYSAAELYKGYDMDDALSMATCHDTLVYQHYMNTGKQANSVNESLARTLHDHGMHQALDRFFDSHSPIRCIGIMGGHALRRTDKMFRDIALISKHLTERDFYMLSGGGPGAMEATHFGAWMAGRSSEEFMEALDMLLPAPCYQDSGWLESAFRVMTRYPQQRHDSLGIPTWLYGHEPTTPFATHIAKFFENSIREDSILTLAFGGIIYTPGSAGTLQEIFQDAVQNHYLSFGFSSPMVFLGKAFWTEEVPIYPFLQDMVSRGRYKNLLLTLTDDEDEAIEALERFQRIKRED
ncbi:MAG: hypothetical protein IKX22_08225 [Prevotella sp.]|nr:hypothetical protein [Prevotella sp.]